VALDRARPHQAPAPDQPDVRVVAKDGGRHDEYGDRRDPLAARPLTTPALSRLPIDHPARDRILVAHADALRTREPGYLDPESGLFVLTARFLTERGYCCERGCRHCPYVTDEAD
jgi:hypothetical protein